MRYKKKPLTIEAIQFTGYNHDEIHAFCPEAHIVGNYGSDPNKTSYIIRTLEGNHICSVGDYIIKGIKGEFYPCKPDIFVATYESEEDKL